ncbi:hypothetical protein, partial [Pseudomonas aeruginosa]|uniref:hypothetical protein n=1 Tax=Pseudomonas aeruginosa TaxID=287 RepID=UPI001C961D10
LTRRPPRPPPAIAAPAPDLKNTPLNKPAAPQLGRGVFLICFLVSMGDYDVLPARADRKHANSPQQMTDSGIRQWLTKYSLW